MRFVEGGGIPESRSFSAVEPTAGVEKVAKELEAVFVTLMLKSMRESMSSEMFQGDGSDTFGGMFDQFMGQHMAEAGSLGLSEMILTSGLSQGDSASALQTIQTLNQQSEPPAPTGGSRQIKAYQNAVNTAN